MVDSMPEDKGWRSRLEPYVSQMREVPDLPYATDPALAFLHNLERAVQSEVDRMVVELRESGDSFVSIAKCADRENPEPWQRWHVRYREAVRRLRGEDEEVLPLRELQARRRQAEKLEMRLKVGPIPPVTRSADNQGSATVTAADLRRGDCVVDGLLRIVVRTEPGVNPEGNDYVMVIYHNGVEYPYACDYEFRFGHEKGILY